MIYNSDMTTTTIKDIARKLGVSGSTVSRALHDDPRISKQVTTQVKTMAAHMGYIPNIAASSLRIGKTKFIGLVVRDLRDGFCLEVIPSIEAACAADGYGLLLCDATADIEQESDYINTFLQRRVDGIIVLTPLTIIPDPYLKFRRQVPLVLVDIEFGETPVPICTVSVDHRKGGYLSTKHLLDLGHRRIAFITGPLSLLSCLRYVEGYKRAMTEAVIPIEDQIVMIGKNTEVRDGHEGMLEILKLNPKPTAVATASDLMAAGALKAAQESGLSVPKDISIVGYDDIPLSSLLTPPLTTIKQDKDELGSIAAKLLFEEIGGTDHKHKQYLLQPSLILRGSTAPPANSIEPQSVVDNFKQKNIG